MGAGALNYVRRGEGEPVVLIHGLGSWWRVWQPVIDRIAGEREVIALDLPGFGDSPPLPDDTPPTPEALSDAVAAFVGELGLDRPLLVGNSLGGWIALELAKRGIPRAVIANSPAGFWSTPEVLWLRAQFRVAGFSARRLPRLSERAARTPTGRRLTTRVFFGHPERAPADDVIAGTRNMASSAGYYPTLNAMSNERFTGGADIRVPVTVVWGRRDMLLFPWQARRALAQMPQARHVSLDDGGHVPMWDTPDELARLVLEA